MKITKYEHACLVVEEQGKRLVIDPGVFASSLPNLTDVVAVIVTHVHGDHFDTDKLQAIFDANLEAQLYTVPAVTAELGGKFAPRLAVPDMGVAVGPFHLEFCGQKHATVHPSLPVTDNTAVLVNGQLFYPGDSFTQPEAPVKLLAVPAAAPWMKVAEAMDYISAIKPEKVFPTHNAVLSEAGQGYHDNLLQMATVNAGGQYQPLAIGQSIEI